MSDSRSPYDPSIVDLISLEYPVEAKISDDGSYVAYRVRETNWKENRYEHKIHVYDVKAGDSHQLTMEGDATQFFWKTNSLYVLQSFEDKSQVYLYNDLIGDPVQITDIETGVEKFKPEGNGILFITDDPEKEKREHVREKYGNVTHFEREESASTLYYTNSKSVLEYKNKCKKLTEDEAGKLPKPVMPVSGCLEPCKILDFYSNEEGNIYLNCRVKDYLVYWRETKVHKIEIDLDESLSAHLKGEEWGGESSTLELPEVSTVCGLSPNGDKLLISHKERDNMSYTQQDLWILDLTETNPGEELEEHLEKVSGKIDRNLNVLDWTERGIYVFYANGTRTEISILSEDGSFERLGFNDLYPGLNPNASGDNIAIIGNNAEKFPEVYIKLDGGGTSRRVTGYSEQIEGWSMGAVETIKWESRDGTIIEGVLRKPSDYDPDKKYPLIFDVHGGPKSFSKEFLLERYDYQRYPVVQFNNNDVLILKPNYRGSAGYGQSFLELNVDNLGVGDLWDLESAVEELVGEGVVDPDKIGCMGWSQGGYISAFAGLHSDKFRAVSVGAGISDWYTYHISNDIPHFTDHYLSNDPWTDPEIYEKTAPISGLEDAHTPMLIQHGAEDNRVPLSNGMELYRALQSKGIHVEFFIYPEMAHPITKPRECRAVMKQNLDWFSHYLLGEELDFSEYDKIK